MVKLLVVLTVAMKYLEIAEAVVRRCSTKIGVLRNFVGVLESLFNNVADLTTCNNIKKKLQHRRFPNFVKYF